MCGILAALGLTGDLQANRQKILRLRRLLRHRGPDASGIWVSSQGNVILAHERLSIIDRSDKGKQPFCTNDPESNLVWIINSEIYNHEQIRKEYLSSSKVGWTGSDSVVLGYLYEKFGPSAKVLEVMDGIFCGVLYDEARDEYFAFRDHMGICPLYYGKGSDGCVWFASEMKALQEDCDVELKIFPPGFMYSSKTGQLERWYSPPWINESHIPSTPVDYAKIKELVVDAVVKRLMSDVPLAVFLSGGLDSSLVASIAARHLSGKDGKKEKLHTFSIGIQGAPDLVAARKVAEHIKSEHHEFHMTVEEGIDALQEIVYYLESYQQIRAATPHYLLARKVKAMGFKVVLSGEGADEALGGYLYFHKAPNPEEFHRETVRKTTRLHQWDVLRANKACYAWGLEPRVPFLDRGFLDCVMDIDPKDKVCNLGEKPDGIHPKMEKWVLRKAFDTPEDPYLPESVLFRQKEQFSDGVGYDWVDGLKDHADKVVSDEQWATRFDRFPVDTPRSKEYFMLRTIFEKAYPNPFSLSTVATGLSIACSTPEAISWDPTWKDLHEISGRAINVHSASDGFAMRTETMENHTENHCT